MMSSVLYDMKHAWYIYDTRIHGYLQLVPSSTQNLYQDIVSQLQFPIFEQVHMKSVYQTLNQNTFRMAAYYFKVFYGLGFVPNQQEFITKQKEFLEMTDPILRG